MIRLRLEEVAAATRGTVVGDGSVVVDAVTTDSRTARPGALFVALRGVRDDGHSHTGGASGLGAAGVLVEDPTAVPAGASGVVVDDTWAAVGLLGKHVRDVVDPTVVAVTGSVGKTTTKDLIAAALRGPRRVVAAEGSFNNELGVPLTLLATAADTEVLVVEIGARGVGHIAGLTPLVRPDVSVVTAVGDAHLEMFGDLAGVARAKGELVEALGPSGTAVLNAADPRVWPMRERTAARAVGYGDGGTVTAHDVEVDELARTRATVRTPWGEVAVALPLPGRHNLDNALAAIAVGGVLGVPLDELAAGLAAASVSRWRTELVTRADGLVVLNDAYNANPTSTLAALDTLATMRRPAGRLVAVLGHMAELGVTEHAGHERVGRRAGAVADLVVAVGRTLSLAEVAGTAGAEVVRVDGPEAVAAALAGRVGADDVVLLKASRSAGLEVLAGTVLADATPRDEARRPRRTLPAPDATSPGDAGGGST